MLNKMTTDRPVNVDGNKSMLSSSIQKGNTIQLITQQLYNINNVIKCYT